MALAINAMAAAQPRDARSYSKIATGLRPT